MKNTILKWLNGALGVKEQDAMSTEDEEYPKDGIITAPDFFEMPPPSPGGLYFCPGCTLLVGVGSQVIAGTPVAEIDTPTHVFEVVSLCSGVMLELLIQSGQIVEPGQSLIKLAQP